MAFRGKKVADIYAELHLDRDSAQATLRGVPGAMGADADRAGRELGKRMTDGLAKAVEASSAKLAKARRSEQTATDAVKLAELRLSEAREKGGQKASTLLALEQRLEQAHRRLADAQSNTTTSTRKLEDAQRRLGSAMGDLGKNIGPGAQKAGDDAGGKLALGMRMAIIRKSPLIAAAIGGALVAGAPVAMAAATGLFAGIGIVAAAQSQKVQSAWLGTWQRIKAGAIADARVIEPVLVRVADQVGASFERMRPRLQGIFSAAAPQIEVFAGGITDLAENALPGLERAIERGMPVTKGLADFLAKTGTGLSDFFDRISEHAPAAGQVFSGLGDTMATLLPLLGEFLGQGAELAADVLPALNGTLGLLLTVTTALGPALPIVGAGLLGLKVANMVTGGIGTLATKLDGVAKGGGAMAGIAGRVSGGLSGIAGAAGPAAAGVGFAVIAIQQWNDLAQKSEDLNLRLGQAFHVGGSQAEAASKYIDNWAGALTPAMNNLPTWVTDLGFMGHSIGDMIPSAENSSAAFDRWKASLGASAFAAEEVKLRTQDLDQQMREYGAGSPEVEAASRALTEAQREQARVQGELEMATLGVTEAMLAQTDAVYARTDADFAHRQAIDATEDSYAALKDAIAEYGAGSEEASDAALAFEGSLLRERDTIRRVATEDLPALMDARQKEGLANLRTLDGLRELEQKYGTDLPQSIRDEIAALEQSTSGWNRAELEAAALGAAADETSKKLAKLGGTEATPKIAGDSSIFEGVHAATGQKLKQLDASVATPKTKLDSSMFAGTHAQTMGQIAQLGGQRPTPAAFLNSGPFGGTAAWVFGQLGSLGAQRPTPAVILADYASGGIDKVAQKLANLQSKTIYVTTVEKSVKAKAAGGPVEDSPIFAAVGRKVMGPGGPTDDLVHAIGPGGADYRLSAGEFINNAFTVREQGDAAFAALNSGRADIVLRRPPTRGPLGENSPAVNPVTGTGQMTEGRGGITINGGLNVTVGGFGLTSHGLARNVALEIQKALVDLERSQS